jgi:hypothetical protein
MSRYPKDQMLKSQTIEFLPKIFSASTRGGLLTRFGCIEWRELLSTVFGACAMFFFIFLFLAIWLVPAFEIQTYREKEVASYGDTVSARP